LLEGHDAAPPEEAIAAIKTSHRRYARRQLTWMRRMEGVEMLDRTGLSDAETAKRIEGRL
jgi:tRNA A37 N6-isopentenylltransferase MiaA